jgi:hypothetical protein
MSEPRSELGPALLQANSEPLSGAEAARPPRYECDGCGASCEGPPFGSGLFIWTRGDELRFEEPPLCEDCALRVSVIGASRLALEEAGD